MSNSKSGRKFGIAANTILLAFSLIAIRAHAQLVVTPIAMGTAEGKALSYCSSFFIKKTDSDWEVVQEKDADLKNSKFERLSGCLGYTGEQSINAVFFSVDARETCEADPRANRYYTYTPRSNGYFSCNSNFANKTILGGLHFDRPIDPKLLSAALESASIKAAATEFAQARYQRVKASAVQSNVTSCGHCQAEQDAIRSLFTYFGSSTTPDELNAAASNYLGITAARQFPSWMGDHLTASAKDELIARSEQQWRRKYAEETRHLLASNSTSGELKAFIKRYEAGNQATWRSVDFDGQLPRLRQLLETRLTEEQANANKRAQEMALAAERERQAEAKSVMAWRKTLQIGTDTFCGPVIEVRGPMIKLALNVQLPGFTNEAWLKSDQIFPPKYGCRNQNGRLSTY